MLGDDDDLKIVFLFFYTAIIYHVAQMLKYKGIEMPKSITFSGTGSKMISIITTDDEHLSELTTAIIENVFTQKYNSREKLEVFCDRATPKEATCKGALSMEAEDLKTNVKDISNVYTATYDNQFSTLNYDDIEKPEVKEAILKEVESFIDFFFKLNKDFDFDDELSVSPEYTKLAKEIIYNGLSSYLSEGIAMKKRNQTDEDKEVEETLFFYPLIGAINSLAFKIGSLTKLT